MDGKYQTHLDPYLMHTVYSQILIQVFISRKWGQFITLMFATCKCKWTIAEENIMARTAWSTTYYFRHYAWSSQSYQMLMYEESNDVSVYFLWSVHNREYITSVNLLVLVISLNIWCGNSGLWPFLGMIKLCAHTYCKLNLSICKLMSTFPATWQ